MEFLRQAMTSRRLSCFLLLLIGIVVLQLGSASAEPEHHNDLLTRGDQNDREILRFRRLRVERQPVIQGETHPLLVRSGESIIVTGSSGKAALSRDGGRTWNSIGALPVNGGKVTALAVRNGSFIASVATQTSTLFFSFNGAEWKSRRSVKDDPAPRGIQLTSGRLLDIVTLPLIRAKKKLGSCTALIQSLDNGKTWSDPRPITRFGQLPGNLAELPDGRLILSYVEQSDPYGARAILSDDGGESWGDQVFILGASRYSPANKPRPQICEPTTGVSTLALPDGTLLSAFDRGATTRKKDEIGGQPAINILRWKPEGLEMPPLIYPGLRSKKVDKKGYLDNGMVRMRPDDRFEGGDYVEQHEMIVFRRLPGIQLEFPGIGAHGVVISRHPDGSLVFSSRQPVIYRSTDEGRSWQKLADIGLLDNLAEKGRWASWGFGVTRKGTFLYSYGILPPVGQGYVARSDDSGKTWSQVPLDPAPMHQMGGGDSSRIIELSDGTVIMSCGNAWAGDAINHWATHRGYSGDIILRSRDDGRSWGDGTVLPPGACETNFLEFDSGKLLMATRYQRHATVYDLFEVTGPQPLPRDPNSGRDMPILPTDEQYAKHPWWGQPGVEAGIGRFKNEGVMISYDYGRSFSTPELVTRIHMVSADVIGIPDGRVVMVYQHKDAPCGVRALVSRDEGNTWETERYILGYGLKRSGRASSTALEDGSVYTLYSPGSGSVVRATIWNPE